MLDFNQIKARLENGDEITFSNDSVFAQIECSFGRTLGGSNEFKIWMGGQFVHMSKTFGSFKRKLIELIERDDLEMDDE